MHCDCDNHNINNKNTPIQSYFDIKIKPNKELTLDQLEKTILVKIIT